MTPHIEAKKEQIASTVLMPGDPLRAKYIAEQFLEDATLVNSVRNMYAYTGKYRKKLITIMASGMGIPSMGIYSYELYNFYKVEEIIRIGTAGAYDKALSILDVLLVTNSYSKSTYAKIQSGIEEDTINADERLNQKIRDAALEANIKIHEGTVLCSDAFYKTNEEKPMEHNCLAVEMESFALFANAKALGKKAACILTVSDIIGHKETELTPMQRQTSLNQMIKLAMEATTKSWCLFNKKKEDAQKIAFSFFVLKKQRFEITNIYILL